MPQPTVPKVAFSTMLLLSNFGTLGRNVSDPHDLEKRECNWNQEKRDWECDDRLPTMAQMIDRLRDPDAAGRANARNVAWFYTNLDNHWSNSIPMCMAWLQSQGLSGYCSFDGVGGGWREAQKDHIINSPDSESFAARYETATLAWIHWRGCWCQAISRAAINPDAYLFTKAGEEWRANSIWELTEFWALVRNPNIQRVWRVDPRPPEGAGLPEPAEPVDAPAPQCNEKELLWSRDADGPEAIPKRWECDLI